MSVPSSTDTPSAPPTQLQAVLRDRVAEATRQADPAAAPAQPEDRRVAGGLDLVV